MLVLRRELLLRLRRELLLVLLLLLPHALQAHTRFKNQLVLWP